MSRLNLHLHCLKAECITCVTNQPNLNEHDGEINQSIGATLSGMFRAVVEDGRFMLHDFKKATMRHGAPHTIHLYEENEKWIYDRLNL